MKRTLWLVVAVIAATSLSAETRTRYLVATRRPANVTQLKMVREIGAITAHAVREFEFINAFAADLTADEAAELNKSKEVRYISPVVERTISSAPLQPVSSGRYGKAQNVPYGIDLIGSRDLWAYSRGGGGVINVVVVDTGIDFEHPDLKERYVGGYSVFTLTNEPIDDHGHGTHVAGTIAAVDNSMGVVGVAPSVRLWGVKVLKANGSGSDENIIAGMEWVMARKRELGGNWIINLSLGATSASDLERETFARAVSEGILVVAAAGNRGVASLDVPARYDGVLAISAIDDKSELADFSSYGSGTAFAAPGVRVLSTVPVGTAQSVDLITASGTPFAAFPLQGSPRGEVTADTVFCGFGRPEEIPIGVAGKIALIRRSPPVDNFRFKDKVTNVKNAGAIGVVMIPNDERADNTNWTLLADPGDDSSMYPLALSVSIEDGATLIERAGTEKISLINGPDDYAFLSGTSMATPHVVGASALVWALVPNATAAQLRIAMKLTAHDLGTRGYDNQFGYGRIDPLAAAKYLAPAVLGVNPPDPPLPRRRSGHNRT